MHGPNPFRLSGNSDGKGPCAGMFQGRPCQKWFNKANAVRTHRVGGLFARALGLGDCLLVAFVELLLGEAKEPADHKGDNESNNLANHAVDEIGLSATCE